MEFKRFHHITSIKYIFSCLSKMIGLHQNETNCKNTLTVFTLRWRVAMCTNGSGLYDRCENDTRQMYPPVGGLPVSQDRLARTKLDHDRITPVILPCEQNTLADHTFKISIRYIYLDTWQIQSAFSLPLTPTWLGYPT